MVRTPDTTEQLHWSETSSWSSPLGAREKAYPAPNPPSHHSKVFWPLSSFHFLGPLIIKLQHTDERRQAQRD